MTNVGIIGSGAIGAGIARLAVAAGHEVTIANSRGPESLTDLVDELGERARAGEVAEAASKGDIVVLAVPLSAYDALPVDALDGKIVLSTGNYYPSRDGRIEVLDSGAATTAEYERSLLPGAVIVKAFNNIVAHHIPSLARPAGAPDRSGLAVAGDDTGAKRAVWELVGTLGFEPVDAGRLAESWRFEPESGAYTAIYAADLETFGKDYLEDEGAPLPPERLRELLAASYRPDVAGRTV
ncbi:NADPH-dependent F420 reductase [Cellulosimicrobium sp. Marseille-Q4280]|uniref:NADPH-dependent F420 reductase n=1 Tax=Cellulosimicrobium sp. Marseille-Q4280 TaxID=2937992 RepID=UPI00203F7FEA|nr:NADPH-dependent F420 reductase [Cellulosimicrobium sp. Marseille-Q4280]